MLHGLKSTLISKHRKNISGLLLDQDSSDRKGKYREQL